MNLRLLYETKIREQGFSTDKAQTEAVETLDRIANKLITHPGRQGIGAT